MKCNQKSYNPNKNQFPWTQDRRKEPPLDFAWLKSITSKPVKQNKPSYWLKQGEEVLFQLRYGLRDRRKRYGCPVCKTHLDLRRSTKSNWFFRHLNRAEGVQCALIDEHMPEYQKRIQRYNAAKETDEHKFLKGFIAQYLEYDSQLAGKPVIEKVVKGQGASIVWKRPDVRCRYGKWNIVFEVQISNTWLSDIVARDKFYTENQTIIIWVFNNFDSCQPTSDTTKADIFFNNPEVNLFVLDELAQEASMKTSTLTFNCYYRIPEINYQAETISDQWYSQLVTVGDLTFDQKTYKPYVVSYYDKKEEASQKLVNWKEEKRKESQKRREEIFRLQREDRLKWQSEERRQKEEKLKRDAQMELERQLKYENEKKEREDYLQLLEVQRKEDRKLQEQLELERWLKLEKEEKQRLLEAQKIENRCPKDFTEMSPKDCIDILFGESYQSRNINNLRNRIFDLEDLGFTFPKDALEIIEARGWMVRMTGNLASIHFERGTHLA